MKRVSDNIKNALKQPTTQRKGRILVDGSYYEVYNVEYYADTYLDGKVVGNAIASQLDFDLPYMDKFQTFKYFDGVWTGDNYEYVDMGTFHVFDENDEDEFNKHITAFDNLIKFNDTFNDVGSYPKTLFQELQNICNQAGVGLENKSITNGDFIIENNQFVNGESLKTVLKAICQISGTYATIKNDKLKLQLYNQTINKNIGTNEIRLKDAKESNALSYNIDGKCKQDGKPTPEAPVEIKTVKGIRNLFDKTKELPKYNIDPSGTIVSDSNANLYYVPVKEGQTYTMSSGISNRQFVYNFFSNVPTVGAKGSSRNVVASATSVTFIVPTGYSYIAIRSYNNFGETITNFILEEGSIAHDSVPYGSWLKVKDTGKNLFDKDNVRILTGYIHQSKSTIQASTTDKIIYIPCKSNTTYTVTKGLQTTTSANRFKIATTNDLPEVGVNVYNFVNGGSDGTTTTNLTITTDKNSKYIVAFIYGKDSAMTLDELLSTIMIEESSIATPYEPYKEKEVLIDLNIYDEEGNITGYHELCSIGDIKDNLEVVSGTLTKRIGKVVLDGSENWVYSNNQFYITGSDYLKYSNGGKCYSSHFKGSVYGTIGNDKEMWIGNASFIVAIWNDITTLEEWKTWLSNNPVTVYYVLAEEETINLTPTNVPLFDGYNNISLLEDIETSTSIEYESTIFENLDKSQHEPVLWKRKTYGINQVVLGMSDIEGEYVLRQDEDDIAKNGVHKLVINDNPFAYTQEKRNELIDDLFNQVRGFGYIPYEMNCEWFNYLEIGDKIVIDDINTLILRINGKSPNSLESMMSSPAIIDSSIKYIDNTNSIDNKLKRTEIIVDKQNQTINSLVNKIVDVSAEKSETNSITLENAHEGQLHYLSIKGNISLLFPSSEENLYGYPLVPSENLTPNNTLTPSAPIYKDNKVLYPSNELFSKSNALLIDDEEYKLDIDFLNYLNNTDCDEFIYEDGKCKIVRRLGLNESGELYKLENEIIEPREDIILNIKSDSTIKMKSFENVIFKVIYLLENEYTNYFATNVEVKSEINQTANEINLKVEQKLDGEEFTGANIMLQINKDESLAQINADKIDLSGKEINLTSDDISINSNDFKVTKDGEIEAKFGTIGGWHIEDNKLWREIKPPKDYSQADYDKIHNYLLGTGTLTQEEINFYDCNGDGIINSYELLFYRKMIVFGIGISNPGKLLLDTSDWFMPIKILNGDGTPVAWFGIDGAETVSIE